VLIAELRITKHINGNVKKKITFIFWFGCHLGVLWEGLIL